MLRIETDWQDGRLVARGIDPATGQCATGEQLRAQLGEICSDSLLVMQASESHQARRGDCLSFGAAQAADLLGSLPWQSPLLAPSTQVWQALAAFVQQRIVRGQFFPTIDGEDEDAKGVWRLLVTRNDELQWLQQISQITAEHVPSKPARPDQVVESFINALTDVLIRRTFHEDPFFASTAQRCRASTDTDRQFVGSLLTEEAHLSDFPTTMIGEIRAWVGSLYETPLTAAFRVVFRLEDPPDEQDEPWTVRFMMQSMRGEGEAVPAARLWELGQDLPPILGRDVAAQRQSLIQQLMHAAEVWPLLKERLPADPAEIILSAAEAVALARQWTVRLLDAGFGVELPAWAKETARELSIQLAVSPTELDDALFLPPGQNGGNEERGGDSFSTGTQHVGLDALLNFDWRVAVGTMHLSDEQFESIIQTNRPLIRFQGQWVQVDADEARRAMEFIRARRSGKMTLAEALRTAHGTSRADTGLHITGITGADWIDQLLTQSPDAQMQKLLQPSGFQGQLRPYQLRGLQWLAFLQRMGIGACLADDMGLGKTIQFIVLLQHEREKMSEQGHRSPGPTLLFAPTSVMGNWSHEMQRFAPEMRLLIHHGTHRLHGKDFRDEASASDLVITTYALAARDAEDFRQVAWRRLALDEAQKVKNPSAASTQAIRSIPAAYRVALTGTPIENHLSELWSIMEILNPGLLGSASQFREQFAVPIERLGDASRAQHLRDLIKPFVLRRTKADPHIAGDLPDKLEMKVYCNLTLEQATLYQRITDEMLGHIDAASGIRRRGLILAALTRLKQICDHPAMLNGKVPGFSGRPNDLDSRSGKCERLIEMLEEMLEEGDSALVFTQYKEMGDLLEKLLSRRLGSPVLYLHGGTPASKRDEMIERFQDPKGEARIFLLSLRAGGLGLNLTRANHVFHFDRWWNPAVEQQATDRAHRIGQQRTVQVHKYICIGTMEERIDKMITEKTQLADRIITSGDEWLTGLSTDDLRKTLQLSADAVEDFNGGAG